MGSMQNTNQILKRKVDLIFISMKASSLKTIKMDLGCNGVEIEYLLVNSLTIPIFHMQRQSSFIIMVTFMSALSSTIKGTEEGSSFNPNPKITNITNIKLLKDTLNMRL